MEPQVNDNIPNEYIKKMFRPEVIRKIADECNSEKHSVWWHFWEWFE
jgi:hypothetical protein